MTDSADSSERIVRTIEGEVYGCVTVEYEDLFTKADYPDAPPEEMQYKQVELLANGWIKCISPRDEGDRGVSQDETCVDYFPPERVNQIHTVLEDE